VIPFGQRTFGICRPSIIRPHQYCVQPRLRIRLVEFLTARTIDVGAALRRFTANCGSPAANSMVFFGSAKNLQGHNRMKDYKSAAVALVVIAAVGFSGCNGRDRGHDPEHVDEHRDQYRNDHPCDRDHDPHCDDRPR